MTIKGNIMCGFLFSMLTLTSLFASDDCYGNQTNLDDNTAVYEPVMDDFLLSVLRQAGLPEEDLYEEGNPIFQTPMPTLSSLPSQAVLAIMQPQHPFLYSLPGVLYGLQLLWYCNLIYSLYR